MINAQTDRLETIQQGAENIRKQNLLSDTFASVALEDINACQYVIQTILGTNDLQVVKVKSQYRLLNLTSKDAILDVLAQDSSGRLANIEIQRKDTVDHARRTRYYGSMIDKSILDKGAEHEELPDIYIIYISETDLWKGGETIYQVKKTLGKSQIPYDDGQHIIYVNAAVDDGSKIAKMMQYFKKSDPNDMTQGALSERVHYLKCEKGGYKEMCDVAEKIYTQGIEQGEKETHRKDALRLQKKGKDVAYIADTLDESIEQIKLWLGMTLA